MDKLKCCYPFSKNPSHVILFSVLLLRPFFSFQFHECCYFLQTNSFPALLWGNEDVTRLHRSYWYKSTCCQVSSVKDRTCADTLHVHGTAYCLCGNLWFWLHHLHPPFFSHTFVSLAMGLHWYNWQSNWILFIGCWERRQHLHFESTEPWGTIWADKNNSVEWMKNLLVVQHPLKLVIYYYNSITDGDFLPKTRIKLLFLHR